MLAHKVVNAEVQRDRVFVRFEVFAVAKPLALETLQFLPDRQECPFNVARGKAF
jgi:hypothetical protein